MAPKRTKAPYARMDGLFRSAADSIADNPEDALRAQTDLGGSATRLLLLDVALPEADARNAELAALSREVTELREATEQQLLFSRMDSLTGLLNRSGFVAGVEEWLDDNVENPDARIAIVYIDLDKFKPINDAHGHESGDFALACFAEALQNALRKGDIVSRFSGDEFVLGLPVRIDDNGQESGRVGRYEDVEALERAVSERLTSVEMLNGHSGELVDRIHEMCLTAGVVVCTARELQESSIDAMVATADIRMIENKSLKKQTTWNRDDAVPVPRPQKETLF